MRQYHAWQLAFATTLLAGASIPAQAWAQDAAIQPQADQTADEDAPVGEIVVTAQRRSESLMSVPLAVSALSGDALSSRGIAQPTALGSIVPNLQVNDSTGGAEPNFTLRGVGLGNDYSSNQASPVGVYADDTYMAFRATHGGQMFDLERVEVLRGPQGTLFGRNTTGGAINFITRKPSLSSANGYVELGYGNYNDFRAEGAVEGTLVEDKVGIRAAVSYDRHDGYVDNVFPGAKDLASADNLRSRLSIRLKPSENLDINLRLFANRARQIQPGIIAIGTGANGANPISGYARGNLGFYQISSDNPHQNSSNTEGAALSIKLGLSDSLTLQSLTSYDTAKSLFGQDVDGSPVKLLETVFDSKYKEFNQELRLVYDSGAVQAQGGVFYGRDRVSINNKYILLAFLGDLGVPADPNLVAGGATIDQGYTQVRISKAAFGQFDWKATPSLTITLGARYTEDIAKYENGTSVVGDYDFTPIVQVIGAPGAPLERRGSNRALTGRAAISYKFDGGPLVYASYSRGYRAGTFNGSGYLSPTQIDFVAPEKVNAYEAGIKGRFLDGALSLAAAGFYYDYTNQQIQDQIGPVAFLRSAGASTLKGFEIETTMRFSPQVSFTGSVGYTDSKYDRLTLQSTVLDGNKLPFAPSVTATGRFDFVVGGIAGGELTISPGVTYTSSQWFTPYNDALNYGILRQGSYALFDATVEWKNGPWSVRAWGKNLSNENVYSYGVNLSSFGIQYFNVNQPRTYGIAVRRTF
ncbi:TonB-dependent receptor [Novosphingobium sp. B1]|uniref:TonB-dependent receptor n=1 Tax=Novosphingobium sp. B1 TaxID=1938756 RepID=UPI0009D8C7FE|nr:TonB-dependent receptor [Novosphingobium sp. B1]SMC77846.1 Outer membrane receptor proteins, mostly Fe transport [Novosphingobium sp. B1]